MRLLIAAATIFEIEPLIGFLKKNAFEKNGFYCYSSYEIYICITGVGSIATTYSLAKSLSENKFDFAVQAGIAGSFDHDLQLGQTVLVQSEQYGDLGAEDRENFVDVFELGLAQTDEPPFAEGRLNCSLHNIPFPYRLLTVSGLTVSTGSGHLPTIEKRKEKYGCQTESMEGAAFHYICLREEIPFLQMRSISNYIEPRDKSKWKIKLAIQELNHNLMKMLNIA